MKPIRTAITGFMGRVHLEAVRRLESGNHRLYGLRRIIRQEKESKFRKVPEETHLPLVQGLLRLQM